MSTKIKQAIDGFLLSCKVEGKSYGTIDCYADKLKGFLWYATNPVTCLIWSYAD
jgi:hypothetical protein